MPQFLRAVRMLCVLYKHYVSASRAANGSASVVTSVPASPLSACEPESRPSRGASVRRAGSFGSLLDSPRSSRLRGAGRPPRRTAMGHRRTLSGSTPEPSSRDGRAYTVPSCSPPAGKLVASPEQDFRNASHSDPFEQLETVWGSLSSWFDLLVVEVQRLQEEDTLQQDGAPPHSSPSPKRKSQLLLPAAQSSKLAAAIVNSAPIGRRTVFLKSSTSFEPAGPASPVLFRDSAQKRRSWHVERVTARYLTALNAGGSLSSLPALERSLSSDHSQERSSEWSVCVCLAGVLVYLEVEFVCACSQQSGHSLSRCW